jgi:hypothetical protein
VDDLITDHLYSPSQVARALGVEALRAIGALFEPGDVIEIRALNVGRTADRSGVTYSGYFNFENRGVLSARLRSLAKSGGR